MVQMMNSGGKAAVKVEVEDPLEEAHAPLNKRSKLSLQQQQSVKYSPLDEPSPLGLRLRKSPSLLDLIEMRLSQSIAGKAAGEHAIKDLKGSIGSGAAEKLKASNFPASILKIGTWEYRSRYEGDLVAKCYFAKHKLVWEVLDGGLKNKIEIQWSDIMALKANYPDDGPGTLDVVLARQPLFYRETNPQPRKHTLWQATSDFTNGQASIHRRHYLQCPKGLLGKHFEKLVQCDPRLSFLSQQPEITLKSPYFEPRISVFEDPTEFSNSLEVNTDESSAPFNLRRATSLCGTHSSSMNNELDLLGRLPESISQETTSPSSVMDTHTIEEIRNIGAEQWKDTSTWDNIRVPGLHTSMSMSDLVSHLEQRISEQRTSSNLTLSTEERQSLDMLEEISRCLFNDSQTTPASDEKTLMSRVNSLCCLLQKDPSMVQDVPPGNDSSADASTLSRRTVETSPAPGSANKANEDHSPRAPDDLSGCKQTSSLPRIDSVGDLLLNLPRIASLPRFLFNIGDDYNTQAR